ncbi:MAG: hypothetical protein LH609_16910 [Rudanella sp.]|nr:hypothetical protein [Rudanella sp.]
MRNPFLLLSGLLFVVLFNACHRPYTLVQRTPSPRFQSPPKSTLTDTAKTSLIAENQLIDKQTNSAVSISVAPAVALVSVLPYPTESAKTPVSRRINRMETLLHQSAQPITEQPRPRPKAKSQLRLGNRIRESLGLPLRQELSWWQRIDWKLKSAVFVIGVAILFAILGLGQLALVFGLIGALLLVLGLKRSFKSRRPWL